MQDLPREANFLFFIFWYLVNFANFEAKIFGFTLNNGTWQELASYNMIVILVYVY